MKIHTYTFMMYLYTVIEYYNLYIRLCILMNIHLYIYVCMFYRLPACLSSLLTLLWNVFMVLARNRLCDVYYYYYMLFYIIHHIHPSPIIKNIIFHHICTEREKEIKWEKERESQVISILFIQHMDCENCDNVISEA